MHELTEAVWPCVLFPSPHAMTLWFAIYSTMRVTDLELAFPRGAIQIWATDNISGIMIGQI